MLKEILVLLFALAGCKALRPLPPGPDSPIRCGRIPDKIATCLDIPPFFKEFPDECRSSSLSGCDRMTCVFTELGWLVDGKVNKTKVTEKFDEFASEHPEWSPAITHTKQVCLGERDLPPQGVYLNCAPYDITHCAFTGFLRKASPSQWKTTPECEYPRDFASACAICPNDCLAKQEADGTCRACLSLP